MEFAKRKSPRLADYDYSTPGYYFVTICTLDRLCVLSTIVGSDALVAPQVELSDIGAKVQNSVFNIEKTNINVKVDKFVIMPNHVHMIIILEDDKSIVKNDIQDKKYKYQVSERRGRRSLQGVIRDFKSVTTRLYKSQCKTDRSLWQDSFYDEVIRDDEHYKNVWEYIDENPLKWELDEYNLR